MVKLLLWLAIAMAVLWLLRNKKSTGTIPTGSKPDAVKRDGGHDENAESMLRCQHCGVHIPASEALEGPAGTVFCSEEHRLLHHRSDS